jgi:hypothetical protein
MIRILRAAPIITLAIPAGSPTLNGRRPIRLKGDAMEPGERTGPFRRCSSSARHHPIDAAISHRQKRDRNPFADLDAQTIAVYRLASSSRNCRGHAAHIRRPPGLRPGRQSTPPRASSKKAANKPDVTRVSSG